MSIRIEDLKYYIEIVRRGNLADAAKDLYISRQGLRNSISKVEAELGAPLLRSSRHGLEPTEYGLFFAKKAEAFIENYQDLADSYEQYELMMKKTIRIFVSGSIEAGQDYMRRLCRAFNEKYPDIGFSISSKATYIDLDDPSLKNYDAVITYASSNLGFSTIPVYQLEHLVLMHKSHRLASYERLIPEQLKDEYYTIRQSQSFANNWLSSIGVPDSHIFYDKGNHEVRRRLMDAGEILSLTPRVFAASRLSSYGKDYRAVPVDPPVYLTGVLYVSREKMKNSEILQQFFDHCYNYIVRQRHSITEESFAPEADR